MRICLDIFKYDCRNRKPFNQNVREGLRDWDSNRVLINRFDDGCNFRITAGDSESIKSPISSRI